MQFGSGNCIVLGCTNTGTFPTTPGLVNNMITFTCGGTALGIEVLALITYFTTCLGEYGQFWRSCNDNSYTRLQSSYWDYLNFEWSYGCS